MFENRRWLVIPSTLVESVDFKQVLEKGPDTLRYSTDGTKTFVKYEINEVVEPYEVTVPSIEEGELDTTYTVEAGIYGRPSIYSEEYNEYNHQEMVQLLSTPEWTFDDIEK